MSENSSSWHLRPTEWPTLTTLSWLGAWGVEGGPSSGGVGAGWMLGWWVLRFLAESLKGGGW